MSDRPSGPVPGPGPDQHHHVEIARRGREIESLRGELARGEERLREAEARGEACGAEFSDLLGSVRRANALLGAGDSAGAREALVAILARWAPGPAEET